VPEKVPKKIPKKVSHEVCEEYGGYVTHGQHHDLGHRSPHVPSDFGFGFGKRSDTNETKLIEE
jgi:hypothetical protein